MAADRKLIVDASPTKDFFIYMLVKVLLTCWVIAGAVNHRVMN